MLLVGAGTAAAHPALISSQPGAGYALTSSPPDITLHFNERLTVPDHALIVEDASAKPQTLHVSLGADGMSLRGVPASALAVGVYAVKYRVIGRDGDVISGSFRFGVATPVGTSTTVRGVHGNPERVQPGTSLFRWLLFLGLAGALGGLYLAWRFNAATGGLSVVRPLIRSGSALGIAGVTGLLAAVGPLDQLDERATSSGITQLLLAEALLLLLSVAAARRPARGLLSAGALLGVVALEGIRAHPSEITGAAGAVLTAVHLLAGALWLGGLVHVLRIAVAGQAGRLPVRVALLTYARGALVLLAVVVITGTISALLVLPSRADWTATTYGHVLLLKLGLVVLAIVAAALARLRVRRKPGTRLGLGRVLAVEAALLGAVVFAAAALTSVNPPALVPVSALLAAPVGPTVRLADRVGQISVEAVISRGRLELHSDAPDDGRPTVIRLQGRISSPHGPEQRLELTPCGSACWTTSVDWVDGTNTLTLDVDAQRWQAGRVALEVQWPPVPAPGLLARVQEAMGARSSIDTVETVTSGFGVVLPSRSRRTGREYLSSQPWSEGGATDATVVTTVRQRTLLFALPALGYHFAMQLDALDRVVSERIVTPNHLLTRGYRFPAVG